MAVSREFYRVTGTDLPSVVNDLNYILKQITDRLDKMEGIRGTISPEYDEVTIKDSNETTIHSME